MFANDFGSHYGTQWNVPNFWGSQNPYFCGFGSIPQNHFGFGNLPYHNSFSNIGTQPHTGFNYGHSIPQTGMTHPFHGYNYNVGFTQNTMPLNYGYVPQGYTPFVPNFQNFQSFQHPFQTCR